MQRDICLRNPTHIEYRCICGGTSRKLTEAGGCKMVIPEGSHEMVKMLKQGGAQIDANGKMVNMASAQNGKIRQNGKR